MFESPGLVDNKTRRKKSKAKQSKQTNKQTNKQTRTTVKEKKISMSIYLAVAKVTIFQMLP